MAPAPGTPDLESLEGLLAAWTSGHPDADHRIETGRIRSARQKIAAALSDDSMTILITGPSGHGKTLLLRSLWRRPPKGFAPIPAPIAGVEPQPDAIAARILAETRIVPPSDPAAGFVRMLRTQSLRGARPVLLIDDLHAASPATIAALVALAASSRVEVRWVAAGLEGPDLDASRDVLPGPPCVVALVNPLTGEDIERLVARIADALPDAAAAIDIDGVLRITDGNPRLVLASLASSLRSVKLPRVEIESAMAPPEPPPEPARPSIDLPASSEPAPEARAVPPASGSQPLPIVPARDSRTAAPRAVRAAPLRAASRERRRPSTLPVRRALGVVAACAALLWLVDRTPTMAAGSLAVLNRLAAVSASSTDDAWRRLEAFSVDASRQIGAAAARASLWASASATDAAGVASATASELARSASDWAVDTLRHVRESRPLERNEAAETRIAAAEAVIPVAVNSDPWSNVEIDGAPVGSTPLTIELPPGPHRFRAAMADGRVLERDFVVGEDRNQVVFD
jgi:hypothetical protein